MAEGSSALLPTNVGQSLLRHIAKIHIFSCHLGKNGNRSQMNDCFSPSPHLIFCRVTQLYPLHSEHASFRLKTTLNRRQEGGLLSLFRIWLHEEKMMELSQHLGLRL